MEKPFYKSPKVVQQNVSVYNSAIQLFQIL